MNKLTIFRNNIIYVKENKNNLIILFTNDIEITISKIIYEFPDFYNWLSTELITRYPIYTFLEKKNNNE